MALGQNALLDINRHRGEVSRDVQAQKYFDLQLTPTVLHHVQVPPLRNTRMSDYSPLIVKNDFKYH